jgi:hypothetical protein
VRERTLASIAISAAVVVTVLVLYVLDVGIWPFSDEKVNCCIDEMLPNAQCAKISKKHCEKVQGQVVERCEDCTRQATQEIIGGRARSPFGSSMAPP